jgi:hypothetical protein
LDQRRLKRPLLEKWRELVKDGSRFDQTEFAAVGTEEAAFVVDEVEQVEFDPPSASGGYFDQAPLMRNAAEAVSNLTPPTASNTTSAPRPSVCALTAAATSPSRGR